MVGPKKTERPLDGLGKIGPPNAQTRAESLFSAAPDLESRLFGDTSPVLVISTHKKWLDRGGEG